MKKTTPTLDQIRISMTAFDKDLLQEIWEHFRAKGEWPLLRMLYNRHGKQRVRDCLISLTGNIGWEESGPGRWSRYRLSLLGILLTKEGPAIQLLMSRFFEFQRQLFQEAPSKEQASSAEIKESLGLGTEDTKLLGQLVWLASFGGGRSGDNDPWTVSVMEEAEEFPEKGGLSSQFGKWVLRDYRPDAVVFREQRDAQYSRLLSSPNVLSGAAQSHTGEISVPLDRLREKYPDSKKLGFLIMRFASAKPFARIVKVIKDTAKRHGLIVVRADDNHFHAELWENVRTLLHGCGFGIAVYERIEKEEPNANVGLEVGYLMAMNKPVLLLKDKNVQTLQSDLAGKLYTEFDPHDPEASIPAQLTKWLKANGIIVPGNG